MFLLLKLALYGAMILAPAKVADNYYNLLDRGLCMVQECCHANDNTGYLHYERGADSLLADLKQKVYGQPLIINPIYRSLRAHLANYSPPRPLVMYFSGWTGTGKTYVAKLIAKNLFQKGTESKYVKYISSSYHFPVKIEGQREIMIQRQRLRDMIRETVKSCPRSLIILDELDKLPSGVVDALQPLVDYLSDIDGVAYNQAIFIFLSNTGAESLNSLAYKMFKEGKERKDLSAKDIEEIIVLDSYNESGGLRESSLLRRHSIGVFIPFLPLERQHVKLCIRDEIEARHENNNEIDKLVDDIAEEMTYFPENTQLYSKSGCKGVHEKVTNHLGPPVYFDLKKDKKRDLKIDL